MPDYTSYNHPAVPEASYRFGPFVVDRTRYHVLRDGAALDLTPKLLDLLFHLLEHAGALVTKEQLLDALWPGANVTDNALAQAVSELREALGDDAVDIVSVPEADSGARRHQRRRRGAEVKEEPLEVADDVSRVNAAPTPSCFRPST